MVWLLIGYMFLFIDRPFEVWPILGDIHLERAYMLFTMLIWLLSPGKKILPNFQQFAVALFALFEVLRTWAVAGVGAFGVALANAGQARKLSLHQFGECAFRDLRQHRSGFFGKAGAAVDAGQVAFLCQLIEQIF